MLGARFLAACDASWFADEMGVGGVEDRQVAGTTRTASKRLAAARSDSEERLAFIQRTALERINDLVLVCFHPT